MSWKGSGSWGGASQKSSWGSEQKPSWTSEQKPSWASQSKGSSYGGKGGKESSWGGSQESSYGAKGGKQQSSWGGNQAATVKPPSQTVKPPWQGGNAIAVKPPQPAKGAAKGAAAPNAANTAAVKAKVAKMTADVDSAEKQANATLDMAKKLIENEKATPISLKASVESVEKHKVKLMETQQTILKERDEARKAGPAAAASVTEMSKLIEKCKGLTQQVTMVLNKLKPKATKAQQDTENKAKEAKDSAAFKPILAKISKDVATAVDAVSAVAKKADPLVAAPPEGEELDKAAEGIETAATEANKKVAAAKTELSEKFKAIAGYAPETKKSAETSLRDFQKKLGDAGRKGAVYQAFKKELPKLVAAQEALKEVTETMEGHDQAVVNATKLADTKIDKEKIDAIDNLIDPVKKSIKDAYASISQKSRNADAATQAKFAELRKKGEETEKKIQAVFAKIKKQRDVIRSEEFVAIAQGKLEKAEEAWKGCQEAEMPFLTGVEVLPGEQNDAALKACAEAITAAHAALRDVAGYVRSTLSEVKGMEKDLCDKLTPELTPFNGKIQTLETSLGKFKKENAERKVIAIMMGAMESVETLEKKLEDIDTHTKGLAGEGLEDATVDSITESIEKAKAVLSDATAAMTETKKVVADKQRESKAPQNDPASAGIQSRLKAADDKIGKLRSAVGFGEKLIRVKKAITSGEEKMTEADAAVAKVQKFEGGKFDADSVKAFSEAFNSAVSALKAVGNLVEQYVKAAPPKAKAVLQALVDKKAEALKVVEKLKADTRDAREEVLVDVYLGEAETPTKATETTSEQMEAAEKPFVVGGDIPLAESLETIKKCEEAAAAVKKAIQEAEKTIKDKTFAVKQFGEAASKKAKEGFSAKSERVKAVSTKLASFEKDLKDRTKGAKMTEASVKVDDLEALLKKAVAAGEPFTKEGGADMSEADVEAPLKAFMEADKEFSKAAANAKQFLNARGGEQKGSKENTETLKKLQERVAKVSEEIAPVKKATKPHEQKSLGKEMLALVKEQVDGLAAEIKKATDACAPLVEKGGSEYLVDASIKTLVKALQAHMKEKELTQDKLWEEVAKGKAAKEKDFVAYLKALPEAISHDELSAFSDERRVEIFKQVSAGGKSVTAENFKGLFTTVYHCAKEVTLTDRFEAEGSETVCKVEVGTSVTVIGQPKEDAKGMSRAEAQVGEKKGWITIEQNQKDGKGDGKGKGKGKGKGPRFLRIRTRFGQCLHAINGALDEFATAVQKVSSSVASKSKGTPSDLEPLKAAREEIGKLKEKVVEAEKSVKELKQKVEAAKNAFFSKEKAEQNAHIEARNLKEAAPFLADPQAKVDAVLAAEKTAQEAGAPLATLTGDELLAFATPASVMEAVEKANTSVTEKANEARDSIKEQMKAASDVKPQTGGTKEATNQLKKMQDQLGAAARNTSKTLATVKKQCASIVNPKLESTSVAIRAYSQKNSLSGEALFDKFKNGEKIDDAGFCKLVESLEDVSLSSEVARLICQKIQKDGIEKDAFLNYVVVYYKVTKTIAFTDSADISSCKTLRKANVGEVIEMLEEPVKDETSGITRIRAKATKDPPCEGWVTLSGNQGSSFLEKTKKP